MPSLMPLPIAAMKVLVVFLITGCATMVRAAPSDIAEQWHPLLADKMKLPQYCWSQFDAKFAKQSGIKMPTQICGVTMNHFCPGLVMLNRAQDGKYSPNTRHDMMKEALGGFNYTLRNMRPNCPLKSDVDAAKARADMVSKFLPRATR